MVIVGLLLIGGVVAVNVFSPLSKTSYSKIPCSSCGNGCTTESNCGNANCGALTGGECKCNSSSGGCGSCNGSCTSESGCGQSGCSVTTGAKTCGCGK
jgi:hypothetical protein